MRVGALNNMTAGGRISYCFINENLQHVAGKEKELFSFRIPGAKLAQTPQRNP